MIFVIKAKDVIYEIHPFVKCILSYGYNYLCAETRPDQDSEPEYISCGLLGLPWLNPFQ